MNGPHTRLTLQNSSFGRNNASDSGGAIYVERGTVILSDQTQLLASNEANHSGQSYFLALNNNAEMVYALPAPLGRQPVRVQSRNTAVHRKGERLSLRLFWPTPKL